MGSAWRFARCFRRPAENIPLGKGRTIRVGRRRSSLRDADCCDRDGRAPHCNPHPPSSALHQPSQWRCRHRWRCKKKILLSPDPFHPAFGALVIETAVQLTNYENKILDRHICSRRGNEADMSINPPTAASRRRLRTDALAFNGPCIETARRSSAIHSHRLCRQTAASSPTSAPQRKAGARLLLPGRSGQ